VNRSTLAKTSALIVLVFAMISLTVAAAAGGSSISLNPTVSSPSHGSTVNFSVSTTQTQPWVSVQCVQGGVTVYQQSHAYYVDPYFGGPFSDFVLTSNPSLDNSVWTSGGASCSATLWYIAKARARTLASTTFNVLP